MRLLLVPVFVVLAAACADLKTADPPAAAADPTEPTEPAGSASPPPTAVVAPSPSGEPSGGVEPVEPDSGSTPSSDGGAVAQAGVDDICEPYCRYRDRCPPADAALVPHADCLASCHGQWAARIPHLDARYVASVEPCFSTQPCGGIDDSCFADYSAVAADPASIPEVKECLEHVTSCAGTIGGPSASTCYSLAAFDQATRTAAAQCFALECSVMRKCMKNTWGGE